MDKPQITTVKDSNGNTIRIDGLIPLYTKKDLPENCWILYSPHFKTYGYSTESEEKALKDFDRAIKLFFDIHIERGTLEKALICFGWKKTSDTFHKPEFGNSPVVPKPDREYQLQVAWFRKGWSTLSL